LPGDGGAANCLDKFNNTKFQITDDNTDLTTKIAAGYAIVWPREHPDLDKSPGATYGHVAIVEEVGPPYVIVTQAALGTDTRMKITREQLKSLYIIP